MAESIMDTTSPLFEKLDECIGFVDIAGRQVETILRGGSISEAEQSQIIQKAHQTFSFLHQNLHSFHSENNRNYYLEIGVKLHNKCRNLVSPNYVEIRALLRAISGLIILAFGDRTAKVFAICIKLLSKSGEEFIRENESRANDCFSICISLWNSAKEETLAIFEQLPPLEIQELKIYIAKCFVGKLTMLTKHFVDNEETTSIIMAALDIIQTLQLSYKFTIIEKLLGISNSYSQLSSKETAINLMHLCLDTLQLHPPTNKPEQSDPSANNENEIEKYIELKMRCCLALSYLYSELKETSKAFACISEIEKIENQYETNLQEQSHAIHYAKFLVAINDENVTLAENLLRQILKAPSAPFETSLTAVKQMIEFVKDDEKEKVTEFFKMLASKFSKDPEYSTIRLAHLQTNILFLRATKDDDHFASKSKEIAVKIVSDHLHSIHILGTEEFKQFKSIMSDQLMWYQSLKAWYHIKLWADVLIVLVENDSDHVDFMIDLSLLKIEALIAMEQYAEALDSTKRLMNKHQSNKILSMLFKTMIYSEDCSLESAINQMKKICIERCPDMNIELKLQQFIECCYILYSIPKLLPADKTKGVLLCLEVWIDLFHQNQIWKLYEESTSGPSQDEFKVLEVVCQYFAYFGGYIGGSQGNDAKDSESVESCSISIDYTLIEAAIKHPEKQNKMLEMLQNKVHPIIRVVIDILNIASRKGISSDYFGKVETFKWLPLSLMELANLFLEQHKDMVTFESGNNKNSNTTVVAHLALLNCCCTNYLLANQLLEAAEQFNIVDKRKRVICLICSASVQLDCAAICSHKADNNDENAMDTSDFLSLATFTDENPLEDSKLSTEVIQYTNQAKENAEQAQNIITGSIEFADQMDRSLLNIAIFIQFQCFSRCGKIGNSEEFINHRENEIKLLSPESLMDCVELASSSSKFSMDAIRNLLRLCIETIAMSHTYSSYLGVLFRKIIDLSPSRKYALDKVTEFEHLLREKHSHLEMKDIDYIFAKSYNFTITLLELDQLSMAEQFAGKSECIGEYCSSEMQNWRDKIQELKKTIQKKRYGSTATLLPNNENEDINIDAGKKKGVDPTASPEHKVGMLTVESLK